MILNLKRLQHVVAIAEEANFSRAAERLGISQPALSRSIAQLEETYGLRLFDRSRSGVALTSAGEALLTDARQLLGQVEAIEQNLVLQSRGEAGRITLGIGPLAYNFLMADLLVESLTRWPSLTITASLGSTNALIAGVLNGEMDFCVCASNTIGDHPDLVIRKMGDFRLGHFVRNGHPLAGRAEALSWEELKPFPRATGKTRPRPDSAMQQLFGGNGASVECDDFDVLRQLTLRSDAIWVTSPRLLEREIVDGEICELLLDQPGLPAHAEIVLVVLRGRTQSAAVRHLIEMAARIMAR